MSLSINTNPSAMNTSNALNTSLTRLSSGSNITNSAYDASGLAIANEMSAQVSGLGQAIMNSNDSIGMIQIADGAMSGIQDNMDRIRVLTLQASNGIMSDSNKAIIQQEIDALLESNDGIAKQTTYNGMNLLDGTGGSNGDGVFTTQSGSDAGDTQSVNFANMVSLIGSIDVTTSAGASSALDSIDNAMSTLNESRADLGASQNQLMSSIRNTSLTQINVASAESQIRDIDFAQESMNFSQQNIMSQIGSFTQAQANANAANVTRLFQ